MPSTNAGTLTTMTDNRPDTPLERVEVVETRDGSKTLYDPVKQVHYRSMGGADNESRYVFVEGTGLLERPSPRRVLELGFGAAVNFTRTARACLQRGGRLEYHSVEYAPVDPAALSFHTGYVGEMARRALEQLAERDEPVEVSGHEGRIRLHLYPCAWRDFARPDLAADAVYYDPFGPRSEPDSWTRACFEVARRHMASEAVLATYSAATAVKRAMFAAGLWVASAPGPGRKREVTFASPSKARLQSRENLELLSRQRYLPEDDHD